MKLKIMIGSFLEPCHQNIIKNNFSDDLLEMFLEHHELEIAEAEVLFNIFDIIIIHTYILGIMLYLFRRFYVQPIASALLKQRLVLGLPGILFLYFIFKTYQFPVLKLKL